MNFAHNADAAQPSLRVLIVDDSPEGALLVVQELARIQFQVFLGTGRKRSGW
jgi:CheY-like chemotaxis protein